MLTQWGSCQVRGPLSNTIRSVFFLSCLVGWLCVLSDNHAAFAGAEADRFHTDTAGEEKIAREASVRRRENMYHRKREQVGSSHVLARRGWHHCATLRLTHIVVRGCPRVCLTECHSRGRTMGEN